MQNSTSASAEKNLSQVIRIDEAQIQQHLGEMVRSTVEQTLNGLLDAEADQLCNARRYEHTEGRTDQRAGHYQRKLHTQAGEVELKMPKLRQAKFETAIIERYRRRESSVEEALMEMYLAGVSVRRVEDITEALWGMRVSAGAVSDLNQKMYERIETWRNRPIEGVYPYVYLDGISLKRTWGGEVRHVAVLVAIGVGEDGYRDILGVAEGCKEDQAGWGGFLAYLKRRGLGCPELFISDKCLGLIESLGEYYPEAQWQRCMVHFYRNVFSVVPKGKVKQVAAMLKAIHAQEDRQAAQEKADAVVAKLKALKLPAAAELVREGIGETLTYYAFPDRHHRQIRTNNPLERIMREIRRRSRVVGCFPDGRSALMLAAARLRYIAGTKWGTRRYMNMERLKELQQERQEAVLVSA
ncbi:MAG TPA: IS256 family transposase [Candidatus Fermentibacter daniensis]|jgi:transposase-like protein|nr:IS256 family transposase [Candidatus Fermentibacter daniensis]